MNSAALPAVEVRAYCDLHRGCSSLKALSGDHKGRVIAKSQRVLLSDVRFEVSAAGLRRTREQGVRNVHAYARGHCLGDNVEAVCANPDAVRIRFNPHLFDTFVREPDHAPVAGARLVAIVGKRCWALDIHGADRLL